MEINLGFVSVGATSRVCPLGKDIFALETSHPLSLKVGTAKARVAKRTVARTEYIVKITKVGRNESGHRKEQRK